MRITRHAFSIHVDPGLLLHKIGNFLEHNCSQTYVDLCEFELSLKNNKNAKVVCKNIIQNSKVVEIFYYRK